MYIFLSSFYFAHKEGLKEKAMTRMQAQLNQEVMSKPFLTEKTEEVDICI